MVNNYPLSQPKLVVRNIEQAAAWLELDGQISDGMWENVRPEDHWKIWCDAKVLVGPNVGRNFYARKDNYNFTSSELLDVVGLRMLGIVRIARALGMKAAKRHEHDVDTDGKLDAYHHNDTPGGGSTYWTNKRNRIEETGAAKLKAALADESYTMKDLKRDLLDLRKIIKIHR